MAKAKSKKIGAALDSNASASASVSPSPAANPTPSTKPKPKPKPKTKKNTSSTKSSSSFSSSASTATTTATVTSFHSSPLSDFLTPFKPAQNQWIGKYMVMIFATIIRCAIGIGSYSGMGTPPMHGDFEAQRHWLEITQHLPLKEWYFYDLQYWGLDYPPLTAYHSWLLGKIGSWFDKTWFLLDASRGIETLNLKTYMRMTALVSEILIFYPAVVQYIHHIKIGKSPIDQVVIMGAILFQPCLILIDHGHFQYNSVMLGFFIMSCNYLLEDNFILASICFVLSIGFKQMALYYAPFIFIYILRSCIIGTKNINFPRLITVGITVLTTFVVLLLPFLLHSDRITLLQQILHRVFPFNRGIFEDKVANFWCSTNLIIKYKQLFTVDQLTKLALSLTTIGFTPACLTLWFCPAGERKQIMLLGFIITSLSFFLFSFQVHEKTILVPLIPALLIFDRYNAHISWFSNFALFSLYPLLNKDQLAFQYWIMGILFNWLIGNLNFISKYLLPSQIIPGPMLSEKLTKNKTKLALPESIWWKLVIIGSYLLAGLIHIVEFCLDPPSRYPDLWIIANTSLSFIVFGIFYLWCNYEMIKIAFY